MRRGEYSQLALLFICIYANHSSRLQAIKTSFNISRATRGRRATAGLGNILGGNRAISSILGVK